MDADTKVLHLNNMLEYIAQFVPVFLHHEITRECTDMGEIFNCIRQYYNLQQSEANFLKLATIRWEGPEKEHPERLYRRILSHLTDDFLKVGGSLKHNKSVPPRDEDLSPTVERLAVLRWLELINSRLPMLIARTFATDLQTRTLKDLQPQIVNAMDSLLEQLRSEDAQVARIQSLQLEDTIIARVFHPRHTVHVDQLLQNHVRDRSDQNPTCVNIPTPAVSFALTVMVGTVQHKVTTWQLAGTSLS